MEIRPERVEDHDAIRRVVGDAFKSGIEARLVDALRADGDVFIPDLSLVADDSGHVVGHVMLSWVTLDDGGATYRVLSLAPLAVAPDRQGTGIGGALVRESTAQADARGEPLVILQGSPKYYGRFGYEPAIEHGITMDLPDWAPAEAAQVLRLAAYDPSIRGRVVYPAAFDEAEAQA